MRKDSALVHQLTCLSVRLQVKRGRLCLNSSKLSEKTKRKSAKELIRHLLSQKKGAQKTRSESNVQVSFATVCRVLLPKLHGSFRGNLFVQQSRSVGSAK
jgi:hypothetical protein